MGQRNGVYEMIRIAVDAMGGDLAPDAILSGVVNSLTQVQNTKIFSSDRRGFSGTS